MDVRSAGSFPRGTRTKWQTTERFAFYRKSAAKNNCITNLQEDIPLQYKIEFKRIRNGCEFVNFKGMFSDF